jgi:hypothetical protein
LRRIAAIAIDHRIYDFSGKAGPSHPLSERLKSLEEIRCRSCSGFDLARMQRIAALHQDIHLQTPAFPIMVQKRLLPLMGERFVQFGHGPALDDRAVQRILPHHGICPFFA